MSVTFIIRSAEGMLINQFVRASFLLVPTGRSVCMGSPESLLIPITRLRPSPSIVQ